VLADQIVVEAARRRPTSLDELGHMRGAQPCLHERYHRGIGRLGAAIVATSSNGFPLL